MQMWRDSSGQCMWNETLKLYGTSTAISEATTEAVVQWHEPSTYSK